MPRWLNWTKPTQQVQSGDIVETVTKLPKHSPAFPELKVSFIKHYGMVVSVDGKKYIIHNIIGRRPTMDPLEEVFKDRHIHRVLRTGLTDEHILKKYDECKHKKYRLWFFNCEHLMTYIFGDSIGYPQRDGWIIGMTVLGIIVFFVILFGAKKKA